MSFFIKSYANLIIKITLYQYIVIYILITDLYWLTDIKTPFFSLTLFITFWKICFITKEQDTLLGWIYLNNKFS